MIDKALAIFRVAIAWIVAQYTDVKDVCLAIGHFAYLWKRQLFKLAIGIMLVGLIITLLGG